MQSEIMFSRICFFNDTIHNILSLCINIFFFPTFSEQNFLDRSKESEGCKGWTLDDVISQIIHYQQGYLMHSFDYPYVDHKRKKCDFSFVKKLFLFHSISSSEITETKKELLNWLQLMFVLLWSTPHSLLYR